MVQTRDTITVCDYFVKEWFPLIIYKLSDGQVVNEEELEQIRKRLEATVKEKTEETKKRRK